MALPDELIRLIKETVRNEVKNAFMLNVGGIAGRGGDTVIASMGDILIRTMGTHKAKYNGTEIGTTSGTITGSGTSPYLAKFTAGSAIGAGTIKDETGQVTFENNIDLYKSGGSNYILSFKHPSDSTKKCQMYLFTGATQWDFIIDATGQLKLSGGSGILFDDPVKAFTMDGAIAMGSNKITGLAAGSVNGDALRYEQLVGVYLPLAGGTMGGNIIMGNNTINLNAGTTGVTVGSTSLRSAIITDGSNDLTISAGGAGKRLRLTSNISILCTPSNLSFDDNKGLDFRGDSVHSIFYNSTGNDLRYTTYQYHKFDTTITSAVTRFEINNTQITASRNFLPNADNTYNCGDASYRWALVRGVTVTQGDSGFTEQKCVVCGLAFDVGEILSLQVVETGSPDAPTRCVPVHNHHKHGDKFTWIKQERKIAE